MLSFSPSIHLNLRHIDLGHGSRVCHLVLAAGLRRGIVRGRRGRILAQINLRRCFFWGWKRIKILVPSLKTKSLYLKRKLNAWKIELPFLGFGRSPPKKYQGPPKIMEKHHECPPVALRGHHLPLELRRANSTSPLWSACGEEVFLKEGHDAASLLLFLWGKNLGVKQKESRSGAILWRFYCDLHLFESYYSKSNRLFGYKRLPKVYQVLKILGEKWKGIWKGFDCWRLKKVFGAWLWGVKHPNSTKVFQDL